jgi:hypothetical protein
MGRTAQHRCGPYGPRDRPCPRSQVVCAAGKILGTAGFHGVQERGVIALDFPDIRRSFIRDPIAGRLRLRMQCVPGHDLARDIPRIEEVFNLEHLVGLPVDVNRRHDLARLMG